MRIHPGFAGFLTAFTLLLLSACGGSSGSSSSSSASGSSSAAATATLSAGTSAVASGSATTLTWSSTNATSCTASGGWSGSLATSGSQSTGNLSVATTYSLTCSGSGGSSSAANVTVNIVPQATITAAPAAIASGSSSTLTWSSTNATSCTASGGWSGSQATSGTQSSGALTTTTAYSLVCSGAGGSSTATATVVISNGAVSVAPASSALTIGQSVQLTATAPGGGSSTWSVDGVTGGNAAVGSISSSGVYTAGTAAGVHTIVATSSTNTANTGTATVAITDLAGVYTYHNDAARDGANSQEYALTPTSVTSGNFHKLFSCNVDGAIYGQPLWVANLMVNGAKHNVVIVATAHNSLYAFDADTSPCATLWQASLMDSAHGASSGETSVPAGATGNLVGSGYGDMTPEVGITGTPVIDPAAGIVYAVSKSVSGTTSFFQRLHAIDITTGNEKGTGSPVTIAATFAGTGDGSSTTTFNAQRQFQRPGLALVNGQVYVMFASHEDTGNFYGWVLGYSFNGTSFTLASTLNVDPNASGAQGGIWMSGAAPAADAGNNLYFLTGNGTFAPASSNYGDSLLKVSSTLSIQGYFAPYNQATDQSNDSDFGAGGTAVLADLPAGSAHIHLLLGGGKDGSLYVLDRDTLAAPGSSSGLDSGSSCGTSTLSVQCASLGGGIFSTGAFWNNTFYIASAGGAATSYALTASTGQFTAGSTSPQSFSWPGATPSVSASGTQGGILWVLNTHSYCTNQSSSCGPAVLYAYDATNLSTLLWVSSTTSGDAAGNAVKFTVPTIANGKVYVGTRGSNAGAAYSSACTGSSATNACGELDVYGLTN